jgi:hypothetical protein
MADNRTKRQKLEAMANQTASPNEAEVARRLLAKMGRTPPTEPRHRPPPVRVVYQTWAQTNRFYEGARAAYTYFYADGDPAHMAGTSSWGSWNPIPDSEEPHWFEGWFSDNLRRQGADERDIANAVKEMRRKNRWRPHDPDAD